ncbi:TPA: O-unit flippase-like protein [Yersinia enterocolitica]
MKFNSQMIWGMLNQGCNIAIPFLILFISYKYLPIEIASIWVIFLSMTSLVILFDFGLSPSIVRNISYVISGAQNLVKIGIDNIIVKDVISYPLLARLLFDIRKMYLYLSILAFIIIAIAGGGYFYFISPLDIRLSILYSWGVFSGALIINLFYLYYTPVLTGFGEIQSCYKANILGKLAWLGLSILDLILYPSILLLSLCFAFSVLCNRLVCDFFYKNNFYIKSLKEIDIDKTSTIPFIGYNAAKLGVVSLGAFLINRSTTLIAGIVCPIVVAGQFVLTMQVFFALMSIGNILLTIKMPQISQMVAMKYHYKLKKLIYKVIFFSSSCYFLGWGGGIFLAEFVFPALGVNISFLPMNYIIILGVIYFLEMNHSICATIITSKNSVPFVLASLFSGGMIILLSIILSVYFSYGVIGLILAQGIVQLVYNNWRWPLMVYNDFIRDIK